MSVRPIPADRFDGHASAEDYEDWLADLGRPSRDSFSPRRVPRPPATRRARRSPPADPPVRNSPPEPPPPPPTPPPVPRPAPPTTPSAAARRYDWRVPRHAALPDELPPERRFPSTFGWTTAWYAIPVALFAAWSLTFPASPSTACARPTGNACPSPRAAALQMLMHGLPQLGAALGIALVIALLIRIGSAAWKPITVGFASAVVGAGAATILFSVLTQSQ
jgi:hypothetical protein